MNYIEMSRLSLTEGLFKDLDNNIVNIDDPDYESKVKDQTFKDFQEHDINLKKQKVIDWLCTHVGLYSHISSTNKYYSELLKPEDLAYTFSIEYGPSDTGYDHPMINLLNPGWSVHYPTFTIISTKEDSFVDGKLPYKFKRCYGHFEIGSGAYTKNLTDLSNIPDNIAGGCIIRWANLKNLSTLPKRLKVGQILNLSHNNIESLEGMPDSIKCESLQLGSNLLVDLTGWNPTTAVSGDITLSGNENLISLRGFPDNFHVGNDLDCTNCGISEIKDWPKNFSVKDNFSLYGNNISRQSLIDHPFPLDLSVGGYIDCRKQGKSGDILDYSPFITRFIWDTTVNHPIQVKIPDIIMPPHVHNILGIKNIKQWDEVQLLNTLANKYETYMKNRRELIKRESGVINEGRFKDFDKTIVSVDDPDYEQKVKDQTFKDLQAEDIYRKKVAEISKWVCYNVYVQDWRNGGFYGYGPDEYPLEMKHSDPKGDLLFYVDHNYEIHFVCSKPDKIVFCIYNLIRLVPAPRTKAGVKYIEDTELPYKIAECQGGLLIKTNENVSRSNRFDKFSYNKTFNSTHIMTSLKNCPDKVNGEFKCEKCGLISLDGCPKEINGDFSCTYNSLTSFEGGPDVVNGKIFAYNNNITSLKNIPAINISVPSDQRTIYLDENPIRKISDLPDNVKDVCIYISRKQPKAQMEKFNIMHPDVKICN